MKIFDVPFEMELDFDEEKHPRDEKGRFAAYQSARRSAERLTNDADRKMQELREHPESTNVTASDAVLARRRAYLQHQEARRRAVAAGLTAEASQHQQAARQQLNKQHLKENQGGVLPQRQSRERLPSVGPGLRSPTPQYQMTPEQKEAERLAKARMAKEHEQMLERKYPAGTKAELNLRPEAMPTPVKLSEDDLRKLCGASDVFDDGKISSYGGTSAEYRNEKEGVRWVSTLYGDRMHIDLVVIDENKRGKSQGSHGFVAQLEAARKAGIKKIDLEAARSSPESTGGFIGYKVWPRLGFDGSIPSGQLGTRWGIPKREDFDRACKSQLGFKPERVSDFYRPGFDREKRIAFWEKNGGWIDLELKTDGWAAEEFLRRYHEKFDKKGK